METENIPGVKKDGAGLTAQWLGGIPKSQLLSAAAVFLVLCAYFTLSWMVDLRYASKEQERYSSEMVLRAQAASKMIEGRVKSLSDSLGIFRGVYLLEFVQEKRGLGSIIDLFEMELEMFPELMSLSYMNASSELVYARGVEGDEGESAVNASIDWSREYWSRLGPDDSRPFYTPLKKVDRYFLQGVIFPVAYENKVAGALIAVVDAETLALRSFEPVHMAEGSVSSLLDTSGAVVAAYSRGSEGASDPSGIFTAGFMKSAAKQPNGHTVIKGAAMKGPGRQEQKTDMIAAWQNTRMGSRDAVIAIASPVREAYGAFKRARFAHMLLELLFAVAVLISAGFLILAQNHGNRQGTGRTGK